MDFYLTTSASTSTCFQINWVPKYTCILRVVSPHAKEKIMTVKVSGSNISENNVYIYIFRSQTLCG